MNFNVTYVFLFPQTTILNANQALILVRPYIVQQLRANDSPVATLINVIESGAETMTTTFHDEAVQAVRLSFVVSVQADTPEFAEQLVTSAVEVERTPVIRPFYCIGKTVEAIV